MKLDGFNHEFPLTPDVVSSFMGDEC